MSLPFFLSAQESYYGALDTITIHGFSLTSGNLNDSCKTQDLDPKKPIKFYLDCIEISQLEYEIYSEEYHSQLKKCTPCVVRRLDYQDSLLSNTTEYGDCRVGNHIEYYPSGKPKTIGHYKVNETGKWNRIYARGYCSVKNGFWSHFDSLGTLLYTETYNEDTLIGKIDTVFYPEFLNRLIGGRYFNDIKGSIWQSSKQVDKKTISELKDFGLSIVEIDADSLKSDLNIWTFNETLKIESLDTNTKKRSLILECKYVHNQENKTLKLLIENQEIEFSYVPVSTGAYVGFTIKNK